MSSARRPAPSRARTATRGPLPAGVYWRRRAFVLGLAFALVFVIARWLTGSSDGRSGEEKVAEQAGARVQATRTITAGATPTPPATTAGGATGVASPTLAQPQGPCPVTDVLVTPSVPAPAEAGGDVRLRLSVQSRTVEACTWQVSGDSVIVRIADGARVLWTTQQCPRAVPTRSVVVRRDVATVVDMTWPDAKESTAGCSPRADWVLPGDYSISAAAFGGEPTSADFSLVKPAVRTVQVTPRVTPNATATKKPKKPVN